jgi:cation diffusion facilitator CzcD-associated flavoprotein CzcO
VHEIASRQARVLDLHQVDGHFVATLAGDGGEIRCRRVAAAPGFAPFTHIPDELAAMIPADRSSHSAGFKDPAAYAGARVAIVGGRQSAFESAALLAEAGAARVHVCHRHDTPAFAESDWSWVESLLDKIESEPGWYRSLSDHEREELGARFWGEGRLKLEPWLGPRVHRDEISIRPGMRIAGCEVMGDGLRLRTSDGDTIEADHVLYATGYKVDMVRVPYLRGAAMQASLRCRDGFPVLDESLQSSVAGLYITSLPAAGDFGLFFAFTVAVRHSARIIGRALVAH